MCDSILDGLVKDKYELSLRARNCLDANGIKTIREMVLLDDCELLQMRNLGRKTLDEIKEFKELIKNKCEESQPDELLKDVFASQREIPFHRQEISEIYDLSIRAKNCLKIRGIKTIDDLLSYNNDSLLSIKNLGKKTLEELEKIIEDARQYIKSENKIYQNQARSILSYAWHLDCNPKYCSILDGKGELVYDCSVNEISFSQIFKFFFQKNRIATFRELLMYSADSIVLGNRFSTDQLDDFCSIIQSHTGITENDQAYIYLTNAIADVFDSTAYKNDSLYIKKLAFAFLKNNPDGKLSEFILSDVIINFFRDKIYQRIGSGILIKDLEILFPEKIKEYQADVLNIMSKKSMIVINGEYVRKSYLSLKKYVLTEMDEKNRKIIDMCVQGKTYKEIASVYDLSRERIRQKCAQLFRRMPFLEEDSWISLFNKYDISCDALLYILKPDAYANFYIRKKWKKGNEAPENILNDAQIPIEMRKLYEQYLNRDLLDIEGRRIKKNFNSIIDYIIENECNDYTSIDELKDKYYSLLAQNAVEITPRLEFQTATKMKISARMDVLWVQGAKFRYYDISDEDFDSLIKILNLESFSDVEISTKYFIDRYSNELSEFDIRDEYELHNLLRKRLINSCKIDFLRMPNIKFGNGSRKRQVFELLEQESPISAEVLAEKYEDLYGVKPSVFFVSYANDINIYLENGIYSLTYPQMDEQEFSFLLDTLIDDVYEIRYIKRIFHQKYPKSNLNKINSCTLKKLGFFIYSTIVYRGEKESFDAFFRLWLDKRDIIDFSTISWLIKNPVAYNRLSALKKEYEWFEYEPYKYVSLRKIQHDIGDKNIFLSYAEAAASFANNELFSVESLRQNGFHHKLDDLGFDVFFYESILKYAGNLHYNRIGDHYIFASYPRQASLIVLIIDIIRLCKSMGIYTLADLLEEKYGLFVEKRKICEKIANSELFYSQTMEKVYINYETFLGDLEE